MPRPIWIDLDNAPHVVFFAPILRELERRNRPVLLTARAVNNTPELAREYGLAPHVSGRAFGKGRFGKIAGTVGHGARLALAVRREQPALAVSHGSRSQAVAAALLRIPVALFFDYENADLRAFGRLDTQFLFPDRMAADLGQMAFIEEGRRHPYPGLKEHLSLLSARRDIDALRAAGVPVDAPYAVVRPESDTAHYLDGLDDSALLAAVRKCRQWGFVPVVVPRSEAQRERLGPVLSATGDVVMPRRQVNGADLLAHARLLVSGGGTMNREAVVLGLPCISMFRGRLGTLDRAFIGEGRIVHAPSAAAIDVLEAPPAGTATDGGDVARALLAWIVERLETLADSHSH